MAKKKNLLKQVEEPQKRTLQDVQNEYTSAAAKCGDKSYRKAILESEIEGLHEDMLRLNKEAEALTQAALEAAQMAAAAKPDQKPSAAPQAEQVQTQ